MCWCSTFGYRVTVVCVCVTVICWCSTFGYRVTVVCELQYCVGTVQLGMGLLLCVSYCNVLVQYSWVQGYSFLCVLL